MGARLLTGADLNGQRLTAVATPSAATDGANKAYVDARSSGAPVPVRFAKTTRTSGDRTVSGQTLVALDTSLNITLPAAAGNLLEVLLVAQANTSNTSTAGTEIDFAVQILNNGTAVRGMAGDVTSLIAGWTARGGDYNAGGGAANTILTSADVYQNTVTVQPMVKIGTSATTRNLFANAGNPILFSAKVTSLDAATSGGGAGYLPLALDTDGVPYYVA